MKLHANGRILDLSDIQIMGILNVTPDSFFDGGMHCNLDKAVDHTAKMVKYGATLIDIGGESTKPGSIGVSDEEELERVLPIINEIVKRFDVIISVNTSSALIIRESARLGAHLINDVRSLQSHKSMEAIVSSNLAICLMHMQGDPSNMQDCPMYYNVIYEVDNFFKKQIMRCQNAGIDTTRLLLDPGFGFGKNLIHNYQLLSNLKYFHHFNIPLLIGISRKSMISDNQYTSPGKQRLIGSVTCAVIAALQEVQIIRVHDVQETMEALQIIKIIQKLNKNKNKENLYELSP